jgi:ubiquinone/menaquinone biosynthesis C-methylase UbiE
MTWWESWFGEEYLEIYPHRDLDAARHEVDFALRLLQGPPGRLLDLCCGAGRHSAALAERGSIPYGLDLSASLLAVARDREPRLRLARGDMRRLPFRDAAFSAIVNFFTSFGYFLNERDNAAVLSEVARVLGAGGAFLCDTFNRDRVLERLTPEERHRTGGKTIHIRRYWDPGTQRLNKEIRIEHEGNFEVFRESIRAYSSEELLRLARGAGLEPAGLYGDFEGAVFSSSSPRMILLARRPRT